ncbi:N5-glutamine methyltransferase family protein [Brevibacterium sp. H602]|uniref:N5-glutamine methyltransferase family protein n=1 Tax=Brevibacterium sp. H602 TaxID=3444316 RepID=UPI003EBE3242
MPALRAAGCVFAEDEAAILIEAAAGPDDDDSEPNLDELVARRVSGEPLEQIVGWVDFSGMRLSVQPGVFVPRQRTALLAAHAVSAAQRMTDSRGNRAGTDADVDAVRPVVLEAFCGVGPVGSAVAGKVPGVDLHLGDAQVEALRCAVENVERHIQTIQPGDSAQVGEPDTIVTGHVLDCLHGLSDTLRQSVSVIAAVPPYVPETAADFLPHEALDFEPSTALFGGRDGLDLVRRLIAESLDWLAPDGVLLIELGQGQVASATGFATERGLEARSHLGEDEQTVVLELRRRN